MSFPTPQTDNARNSVPSTNLGWFPRAPENIGTPMDGLPMANPMGPPMNNVQYTDEDYSTHHNAVVTGQLFLESAKGVDLARPTFYDSFDAARAAESKKIQAEFKAPLTEGQNVVANVGEVIFSVTSEDDYKQRDEYDIVQHFAMPTSDENSVPTPAMTVPQLNQYLKKFSAFQWSQDDVDRFADSIRFYGVLRALGPGENQIAENNVKNYVHVCERVVLATDIWGNVSTMDKGVAHTKPRPYGSRLFVELIGEEVGARAGVYHDLELVPFHTMKDSEATDRLHTVQPFPGKARKVLFHWFIGSFRSVQFARAIPPAHIDKYVSGDDIGRQQHLPVIEMSVAL